MTEVTFESSMAFPNPYDEEVTIEIHAEHNLGLEGDFTDPPTLSLIGVLDPADNHWRQPTPSELEAFKVETKKGYVVNRAEELLWAEMCELMDELGL